LIAQFAKQRKDFKWKFYRLLDVKLPGNETPSFHESLPIKII
jgi:hypothetical protein